MDVSQLSILRFIAYRRRHEDNSGRSVKHPSVADLVRELSKFLFRKHKLIRSYDENSILMDIDSHKTEEASHFLSKQGECRFGIVSYRLRLPVLTRHIVNRKTIRLLKIYRLIRQRYSKLVAREFLEFRLHFSDAAKLFHGKPPTALLVVSDLSPRRLAYARASNAYGVDVIYYQYGERNIFLPPFESDVNVCINNSLYEHFRNKGDSIVVRRPFHEGLGIPPHIKEVPVNPVIGIVTNVRPDHESIDKLSTSIREKFNPKYVIYKPHPNSNKINQNIHNYYIFDSRKSIEYFSNHIDLCICGNTSASLKLIFSGVPCIYIHGIDFGEYDIYGYCWYGIIISNKNEEICINKINNYYSSKEFSKNMNNYYNDKFFCEKSTSDMELLKEYIGSKFKERGAHEIK